MVIILSFKAVKQQTSKYMEDSNLQSIVITHSYKKVRKQGWSPIPADILVGI